MKKLQMKMLKMKTSLKFMGQKCNFFFWGLNQADNGKREIEYGITNGPPQMMSLTVQF